MDKWQEGVNDRSGKQIVCPAFAPNCPERRPAISGRCHFVRYANHGL